MQDNVETIKNWLGTGSINIFGLPFAGKDTQGRIIADLLDGLLISSGDVLRQSKDNQKLQSIMAKGEIIPSSLWAEVIVPFFARQELNNKPLILSEVGRLDGEQQVVEQATLRAGHPQKAVVLLTLSDSEIWKRFEISQQQGDRGERADDKHEVIQTRLDSFYQKVMPVIEYYREKGLLLEVDGSLSRDEVTNEILEKLAQKAK